MVLTLSVALLTAACARSGPAPAGRGSQTGPGTATVAPSQSPVTGFNSATVTHFAGKIVNGDFTAAIAVVGGNVVGYICDCRTADAWLNGPVAQEGVTELKPVRSMISAAISVTIDDQQAVGTVTWRGKAYHVSLPAQTGRYGLYRAQQGDVSGGWILLPGEGVGTAPPASCGLVTTSSGPVAASPFAGTGPVDVPGHGSLTPHRIDQL
jgi:hypothetical protein